MSDSASAVSSEKRLKETTKVFLKASVQTSGRAALIRMFAPQLISISGS